MKPVLSPRLLSFKRHMLIGLIGCCLVGHWMSQPAMAITVVEWLIGSSVSEVGPKYNKIEDAVNRFRNNDFQGALAELAQVKQDNPELPPAGVLMGKLFAAAQNSAAAREAIERAVRDEPNDPEPYVVFADAALQERRWTDAQLLYSQAKQLSQNYSANPKRKRSLTIRCINGLATLAEVRRDWDSAEQLLQQMTEMDPTNLAAFTRLGRVLFQQEGDAKKKAAYAMFQKVYDLDKERVPRAEINMARLYQQTGLEPNAKKLYELALQRDAGSMATQLAVAQWGLDTGRVEIARKCAAAARGIDPNHVQVKLLEGLLSLYDKNYPTAESAFQAAHLLAPGNPAAVNQLAIALVEQSDEAKQQQALEYAQLNMRRFTDRKKQVSREAAVTYAWVLYRSGRVVEAERMLKEALGAGSIGQDSAYFAARILSDRERPEAALQLLKPAVADSKRIFPSRKEAEALYDRLSKSP